MKMAAKSGNVGIFNKAKEAVLLKGKVSSTTIRAIAFPQWYTRTAEAVFFTTKLLRSLDLRRTRGMGESRHEKWLWRE